MGEHGYDVVIIGGGVAGLTASIYLAGKGFRTALVSRGDPACCLSTGCIDVLGAHEDPMKGIDRLPRNHPYRIAGRRTVIDALEAFLGLMEERGLPYRGSLGRNTGILTPIGTTKTTCLVPITMEASSGFTTTHIHVVSFKGLRDFYPSYITSRLANTSVSVFDAGTSSTLGLATKFDEPSFVDDFCAWLSGLELPPGKIAVPAVLGLKNPKAVLQRIRASTGREIFEIPTLPPSVPGIRLFRALKDAFLARGGHLYWGNAVASVETRSGQVEAITMAGPCRPSRAHARAFILATGSFVGGGLFAQRGSVRETVFDLDVKVPGPRRDWFLNDFFSPGHPVEASGIEVDSSFRPLGCGLKNLFACGSILAHGEIMRHRCGHGLAIATGSAAARACERLLS